jgi:hypothetical protein
VLDIFETESLELFARGWFQTHDPPDL